jgi:sugar phosphate isomerase/epimerase
MLSAGLVSITFRKLKAEAIVELVAESGQQCIEWGGDLHCPHGDLAVAEDVREITAEASLRVSAYGSYYRLAAEHDFQFSDVVGSARALGAPIIRVWPGNKSSSHADDAYRQLVADDALRCADLAAAENISIAYEFHSNTLTDTNQSAADLLAVTNRPNISTLWQPPNGQDTAYRLAGLKQVLDLVSNVHCFSWDAENNRLALDAGDEWWTVFLAELASSGRDHDVLLEFVADDDPENFRRDAAVLNKWLAQANRSAGA